LDYPLSPSRLQAHLLFLLTNTAYEHEEGRLQALEMLQQVRVCVLVTPGLSESVECEIYRMSSVRCESVECEMCDEEVHMWV